MFFKVFDYSLCRLRIFVKHLSRAASEAMLYFFCFQWRETTWIKTSLSKRNGARSFLLHTVSWCGTQTSSSFFGQRKVEVSHNFPLCCRNKMEASSSSAFFYLPDVYLTEGSIDHCGKITNLKIWHWSRDTGLSFLWRFTFDFVSDRSDQPSHFVFWVNRVSETISTKT